MSPELESSNAPTSVIVVLPAVVTQSPDKCRSSCSWFCWEVVPSTRLSAMPSCQQGRCLVHPVPIRRPRPDNGRGMRSCAGRRDIGQACVGYERSHQFLAFFSSSSIKPSRVPPVSLTRSVRRHQHERDPEPIVLVSMRGAIDELRCGHARLSEFQLEVSYVGHNCALI